MSLKKIGLFSFLFLMWGMQIGFSQEVNLPLLSNPQLMTKQGPPINTSTLKKKAVLSLPFIDFFEKGNLQLNLFSVH